VAELTCTDVSRAMVAEARRNLASCPNVRCAVTDGFTLREFEDDAMDLVFAAGVLTYLAPNPLLAMLDEITRVLRPGGVYISNYGLIDDPDAVRQRLDAVRRAARSRRFNGSVEEAYIESQVTASRSARPRAPSGAGTGRKGHVAVLVARHLLDALDEPGQRPLLLGSPVARKSTRAERSAMVSVTVVPPTGVRCRGSSSGRRGAR